MWNLPHGSEIRLFNLTIYDTWNFSASGIPTITASNLNGEFLKRYHTQYESLAYIDCTSLEEVAEFSLGLIQQLDEGLLPFSFVPRAEDLRQNLKEEELLAAGVDAPTVSRLIAALNEFSDNAKVYDAKRASIPPTRVDVTNKQLLLILKVLYRGMSAVHEWTGHLHAPHEQVLADTQGINAAIRALKAEPPDRAGALKALEGTGMTPLGIAFSYPVWRQAIEVTDPSRTDLYWASLGKLPYVFDVIPEYRLIERGEIPLAVNGLEAKRKLELEQLNRRLADMSSVLEKVNALLEEL